VPIPVVGGVRSLAVVDLDRDGRLELLIGDGWNRDYGHVARARLTHAFWSGDAFQTELLEDSAGQYTLWDVAAIDLDRDDVMEIVTRGSSEVRLLARTDGGWQATRVGSLCHDLLALPLATGPVVLLACEDGGHAVRR
jgi:hypothetical protein